MTQLVASGTPVFPLTFEPLKRPAPVKTYISHKNTLAPFLKYLRHQHDIERADHYTPNVSRFYSSSIYQKHMSDGEARMRRVEAVLDSMYPAGKFVFQIKLHRQVIRAVLRQILGDDYHRLVERVCKERGWDGPKKNLFTIASRRSGKTTGMAGLVATLLICVPHIQIVVYSVALRTATEFVRLVERYICMHPGGSKMILNPGGSETLMISGEAPGDMRRIRSFPSGGNAKNVRNIQCVSAATGRVCVCSFHPVDRAEKSYFWLHQLHAARQNHR